MSVITLQTHLLALSADVGRALTEEKTTFAALQRCAEAIVTHLEAAFARIWTLNEAGDMLELQASEGLYTHLDGPHGRVPVGKFKIGLIAQERLPHLTNAVIGDPRVGDQEWAKREGMVAFAGHPLIVEDRLVGVMALFARHTLSDVTLDALAAIADQIAVGIERQQMVTKLREQTEALETILHIGQTLSAQLDLESLVQAATDAATEVTCAQFGAFFYNVINPQGKAYMLYTLSGVPREQFADFPMPRATQMFAPTFAGEGVIRIADVTQDPRYGRNAPYHGKPPGHLPVVSYLAVPVISRSGEVIGGLLFGHEEAGMFTARHETIVAGLAAQTAIAIDNARLYQAERERTDQLARAIQEVHHRVKNSLQGVSALLEMQLPPDDDVMPVETVREGLNQIKTIALVHDLLAHDQPIGKVNVGTVLTNLVELLASGMRTPECPHPISIQAETVWIPTKAATALALTVNELISNAAKHSGMTFEGAANDHAAIEVTLANQNNDRNNGQHNDRNNDQNNDQNKTVCVRVQDYGPGFPPDFNPVLHANIGLELVLTLVRHDLHGVVTFSNRADAAPADAANATSADAASIPSCADTPEASAPRGGRVEIVFAADGLSD